MLIQKMKKYLLFLFTVLTVCSLRVTDAMAAQNIESVTTDFRLAKSQEVTSDVDAYAQKYWKNTKEQFQNLSKEQFQDISAGMGITEEELAGASLGEAFTIYGFDKNGKVVSDDALAYPVFYNGKMIALLEMGYDSAASNTGTFGKSCADRLDQILHSGDLDTTKGLILGRIADKLFLTDGVHVEIILETRANMFTEPETISKDELGKICVKLPQAIDANYVSIVPSSVESGIPKNLSQKEAKIYLKSYLKETGKWKTGYVLTAKETTSGKKLKIGGDKAYRFRLKDFRKQKTGKLVADYAVTFYGTIYLYVPKGKKYVKQQ